MIRQYCGCLFCRTAGTKYIQFPREAGPQTKYCLVVIDSMSALYEIGRRLFKLNANDKIIPLRAPSRRSSLWTKVEARKATLSDVSMNTQTAPWGGAEPSARWP